jgi:hypothetical protein
MANCQFLGNRATGGDGGAGGSGGNGNFGNRGGSEFDFCPFPLLERGSDKLTRRQKESPSSCFT